MALQLPPPAHYAALDMHQAAQCTHCEFVLVVNGGRRGETRKRESWGMAAEAGLGAVTSTRRHSSENELESDLN